MTVFFIGYMATQEIENICILHQSGSLVWSKLEYEFTCTEKAGIILGGMGSVYGYLDDAEIYAPNDIECQRRGFPKYTIPVLGAVDGFVGGYGVICGGAIEEYSEINTPNGKQIIMDIVLLVGLF